MRCSCHVCDTYMTHSEGMEMGCVCPECGYRCKACLGTDSVISRENLKKLADNPAFLNSLFEENEEDIQKTEFDRLKHEKDEYID